ncbi:natterin-4-like [Amblyomma americanum]
MDHSTRELSLCERRTHSQYCSAMANYGSSMYRPPCHWVLCHKDHIPHNAVAGGDDKEGEVIYIGRAVHNGDVIPGKVVRSMKCCYIPYGGVEPYYYDYQALVSDGASLAWLPASNGAVPSGAIQGGVTASGEPLYIARARHDGMLLIGKVHPSWKCAYIPFHKKEYKYTEYQVLVCKTINF